MVHVVNGVFAEGTRRTVALAIGVIIGAQAGARLANHVRAAWILRSLAAALVFVGIRIVVGAL